MSSQASSSANAGTWAGFLLAAFAVLGLIGAMATFAEQVPFDRAFARSQALDQAVAASARPHDARALEALRPLLGDSADRVLTGSGTLAARAAQERTRMLAQFHAEAADYGFRLRLVIAVFTAAAALFGGMVLSIVRAR